MRANEQTHVQYKQGRTQRNETTSVNTVGFYMSHTFRCNMQINRTDMITLLSDEALSLGGAAVNTDDSF